MATRWRRRGGIVRTVAGSLEEFIGKTDRITRSWSEPWFRGQNNAAYDLKPGIYRHQSRDEEAEDELRWAFQQRVKEFPMAHQPTNDWERYFLMQHYGVPTRLLDWTTGALFGLYFALRSNEGRRDAAVWIMDPVWLNEHTVRACGFLPTDRRDPSYKFTLEYMPDPTDKRTKWIRTYLPQPFSGKKLPLLPAALEPASIDRRIAAQLSAFTIHGSKVKEIESIAGEVRDARLVQIRIPGGAVKKLRRQLDDCGVAETTVYPDVDGLGRELKYRHLGPGSR